MRALRSTGIVAAIALATACATTHITNQWKNPELAHAPPRKVVVVALMPSDTTRLQVENELSAKLGERGIQATPLSRLVKQGEQVDRQKVSQVVAQNGFEGVLLCRFLGREEHTVVEPGTWTYGYGWGDYYGFWGPRIYDPGYVATYYQQRLETTLFDARAPGDHQLVWAAETSTQEGSGGGWNVPRFAATVVKRLEKDVLGGAKAAS